MKTLFIGGTGNISSAVSRLAIKNGIDLYLLTRGKRKVEIAGAKTITTDICDKEKVHQIFAKEKFDVVVNWIGYLPVNIKADVELLLGKVKQYIYISSASVYQKPPLYPIITESTPTYNPYWKYSQNKIACEEYLISVYREQGFPITIVRPSLTYNTLFPIAIGGWGCYTIIDRMKRGGKIIVHGDGSSLWTVTHSEDFAKGFVGLIGHQQAIGHCFHITSDEILTWDQIYKTIADAAGVEANIVHIPTDFINRIEPDIGAGLLGDKGWSVIFDNSKIKTFVPEFKATITFSEGIKKTLEWFNEDETRKIINPKINETMDKIISAYEKCFI
ncbi:MAG: NAD-dependent epimerase/dehydratase family protein [Candidatus Firestonebacteria bacterium]